MALFSRSSIVVFSYRASQPGRQHFKWATNLISMFHFKDINLSDVGPKPWDDLHQFQFFQFADRLPKWRTAALELFALLLLRQKLPRTIFTQNYAIANPLKQCLREVNFSRYICYHC